MRVVVTVRAVRRQVSRAETWSWRDRVVIILGLHNIITAIGHAIERVVLTIIEHRVPVTNKKKEH